MSTRDEQIGAFFFALLLAVAIGSIATGSAIPLAIVVAAIFFGASVESAAEKLAARGRDR